MVLQYFITALLVCCSTVIGNVAPGELCKTCKCGIAPYYKQSMYIVNCTYAGIRDNNIEILQQLPDETEVLIFNGNKVHELPINIFGNEMNLTNLKVIDMTDNEIEEIKGKTFHHVPLVERLILNHNSLNLSSRPHPRVFSNFDNLRELHLTDAFLDYTSADLAEQLHTIFSNSNLTQLRKLHLEQNEIQSFADRKVFCDLKNLTDLYLGNNELNELNFEIQCLPHLRYIDLEANKIERFSKNDLAIFDSFPKNNRSLNIDIHRNPFVCDCVQNNLYFWLRKTQVEVRNNNSIQCHYSHSPNDTISLKDFNASNCNGISYNVMTDHKFVHYFFLSTSSVLVVALIYLSVKYSLVYCRHAVTPASKVHYIVIRNADETREFHV